MAAVLWSVSWPLSDTDVWQHLAVGRTIWTLHAFPTRQLWTWPNYGAEDVNASWGFRALIWPLWSAFGVAGLFAWRWATTLAAFAMLWLAARRMGAKGFAPLVVAAWCALIYRHRSQIRPETLVAVLFAAEIWILENWTNGGKDRRWQLVPIALIWANAHISYWLGLALQGIYLVAGARSGSPKGVAARRPALVILLASALVSFVNPWGWKALWQPFDYYLHWRHEPIFRSIGELQPVDWGYHARNGLLPLVILWPVLWLWRALRFGADWVEALLLALLYALALPSQRFTGLLALGALPFVSRDLDAFVRSRPWVIRKPASPWLRGALTAALVIAISLPEWTRPEMGFGIRLDPRVIPTAACDFMEAHSVRGRGYNPFSAGGYMIYRFWPDRTRLPFMDIHQSGSREDRTLYATAQHDSAAWRALDAKYTFDYALILTHQYPGERLLDFVSADSATWALVFTDDVAALFVRRAGPLADVAGEFAYHLLPAGIVPVAMLDRCAADSLLRRRLEAELERAIAGSPWNGRARLLIAPLYMMDGRLADAHATLDRAIADNPYMFHLRAARGEVELAERRYADAEADFRRERALSGPSAYLDQAIERSRAGPGR